MNASPASTPHWSLAHGHSLSLDRPRLLGIVNVTPDSFSDAGRHATTDAAFDHALRLIDDGADMLDIGGESTRPGAGRVPADQQITRIVPVITALRSAGIAIPISVDTTLAPVAQAALDAGANAVNDVSAATDDPAMLTVIADHRAGVILMHRRVAPAADVFSHQHPREPDYGPRGVVHAVCDFLRDRSAAALAAGIAHDRIVLDPGLGFGKSVAQNYRLIARITDLAALGFPVLSAASRKSFIGAVADEPDPTRRIAGSVAITVAHALAGVRLFRVHDVRDHAQALRTLAAIASDNPA